MSVKDLHADLYNYSGRKDFQVYSSFIDETHYSITVKRLDSKAEGWTDNLKIFCWFRSQNKSETIQFGSSQTNEKTVSYETTFTLEKGDPLKVYESYDPLPTYQAQKISRKSFNRLFDTDIIQLPKSMFAVGLKNGCVYMYNDTYEHLYMIELTIKNIIGVALKTNEFRQFYFIISAFDGYLEHNYLCPRTTPYQYGETDLANKNLLELPVPDVYPLLHKDQYVLAQSHQTSTPFAINVPDRYYFYLNRYNEYRSVHRGIAFKDKLPQIVYGSLPRGSKYNFTKRRDINVSQREYFYSDAVPKDNIVAPKWIERADMINYKYILDIDGNASTWDATAWKLNSGSVILKTESCWTQWFYDKYKPWENYVPVADDFSDLQEKLQWCEAHQTECEQMIERNLLLFQEVYRFNNVMEYIKQAIRQSINLQPTYTDLSGRNLYIFDIHNQRQLPITVNYLSNFAKDSLEKTTLLHSLSKKIKPTNLLMYVNTSLLDVNSWNPEEFLKRYDDIGSSIVFGAERNLWPGSLEPYRHKVEQQNTTDSSFKYLNSGMIIGTGAAIEKLLDERIYEGNEFNDQEFYTLIYMSGRYPIKLDYNNRLIMNTFKCNHDEINKQREAGVPLVLWNGGRF